MITVHGADPGPGRLEGPFPVQTGDTFLLSSDGLSGQSRLPDSGRSRVLEPGEAAHALVHIPTFARSRQHHGLIARITGRS